MSGPNYDHLRVLVIEDNAHMRSLLHSLLHAIGLKQVIETPDGASAFAALRDERPDLVLTDLDMRPMDGIEFTRKVRTDADSPNPYLPIIMVTGHTELAKVIQARDAGVNEFLAKPITVRNLQSRLTQIIERPRPFVRCTNYFGPDRRRRKDPEFRGPFRREGDVADEVVFL
ncbi:MAG: response regulator [Alphaproteobacteria bacterium]|nr:response regulator [Alphaproteobacteria bacterium]